MLKKLQKGMFYKTKDIFSPLRFQLFPAAVVAGLQEGDIYVDDQLNPGSALMVTREVWAYLAGEPNQADFNKALNQAIFNREITGEDSWGLLVSCPKAWEQALKVIFHPRDLIKLERRHYRRNTGFIQTQHPLPEGYELRLVEPELRQSGCELPEDVVQLLESWDAIQEPELRGYGFVTVKDGKIAAHAVVDVIVDRAGDIGLVTSPKDRLRGLGTALSAACVDYGVGEKGLREFLWDCRADNKGSIRIAEKLGFEFQESHSMFIFDFEPVVN